MKHEIKMNEIEKLIKAGITTFMKKDDSPRGVKCVPAHEVKIGDKVVIDNYFTTVIE